MDQHEQAHKQAKHKRARRIAAAIGGTAIALTIWAGSAQEKAVTQELSQDQQRAVNDVTLWAMRAHSTTVQAQKTKTPEAYQRAAGAHRAAADACAAAAQAFTNPEAPTDAGPQGQGAGPSKGQH